MAFTVSPREDSPLMREYARMIETVMNNDQNYGWAERDIMDVMNRKYNRLISVEGQPTEIRVTPEEYRAYSNQMAQLTTMIGPNGETTTFQTLHYRGIPVVMDPQDTATGVAMMMEGQAHRRRGYPDPAHLDEWVEAGWQSYGNEHTKDGTTRLILMEE